RRGYPLGNSLHGKLQALQLAADGRIEQARADLHDETAENVWFNVRVDGNLGAAQDGAQRVGKLLQLGGGQWNGGGDGGRGLAAAAQLPYAVFSPRRSASSARKPAAMAGSSRARPLAATVPMKLRVRPLMPAA